MKKISILAIALFSTAVVMAQDYGTGMHIELKDGSVSTFVLSDIRELSFAQASFADNYKSFPIAVDPEKASTPDGAVGCHNGPYNLEGKDGDHLAGLFSPDLNSYFTTCYWDGHHFDETYNSYVDIDLEKNVRNIAFEIALRGGNRSSCFPKIVKIYAMNSSGQWVQLGDEVTGLNEKVDPVTHYAPVGVFTSSFEFSKVRFSVVQGWGKILSGTMAVTEAYWDCGHLAVYGL